MPTRPTYYTDCASGLEVPADGPRPMTREQALGVFDGFRESASFIGVVLDACGGKGAPMVQLLWGIPEEPRVTVDVPDVARKGSFQREVTVRQARVILSQLFEDGASPEWIAGLQFQPW